jgi:ubiquinone/menaquinone biosynthesis C-methylase UbiE
MDAKELNALVHDREAAFYDDRFLIDYDRIGPEVRRDLRDILGRDVRAHRALDVACGTGYAAIGLAAAGLADEAHASDLSAAMVERTRANAARAGVAVPLTQADAESLPYADDSFDLVVARGALHHVPDPLRALQEIRRVLQPGGTAIVLAEPTPGGEKQTGTVVGLAVKVVEALKRARGTTETEEELVRRHWELASIAANLHTFEPEQVASLAEKAGFEEIDVGTAWWSWILVLGINYYLVGEFERLAQNRVARAAARTAVTAAMTFDRLVADRVVPPKWRHTIQAVLR